MASIQPAGTVTLVFTDIEESTRLLRELGTQHYRVALERHRRIVREAFAAAGGYEVEHEGDSFFYAFGSAQSAVDAVSQTMRDLHGGPIRIRVGIHTGEPEVDPPKYVGIDVHCAARIMSAAHGGQVLLSPTAVALLEPDTVSLRNLGEHRLKSFDVPITLHQLHIAGLPYDFPPLRTVYRSDVPVSTTSFVGRADELRAVVAALTGGTARVLTLVGPGGTGKTRLALEAASAARHAFTDGTAWVGLAQVRDSSLVVPTIARSLRVGERMDEQPVDTIVRFLSDKALLLLIDNAEHVLESVAQTAATLAAACPNVRIVVTSRERLCIAAETTSLVPALAPDDGARLFVERARAAGVHLKIDQTIEELCRRVDHLPLAIELAAARTPALAPAAILARLDRGPSVLASRARDIDERQRTLEATIAWSYDLLGADEQRVVRGLSVFAGGWTLEAAEDVVGTDVDVIEALIAKSLVRHHVDPARQGRYSMLETIREFAALRLDEAGESDGVRWRHLSWYAAFADGLAAETRRSQRDTLAVVDADAANILIALETGLRLGAVAEVASLFKCQWFLWLLRGGLRAANSYARRVAELDGASAEHATALTLAGEVLRFSGDPARAIELKRRALTIYETLGETRGFYISTMTDLAEAFIAVGDYEEAERYGQRAVALQQREGGPGAIAHASNPLILLALRRRNFEVALALAERATAAYVDEERWADAAEAAVRRAAALRGLARTDEALAALDQGARLLARVPSLFVLPQLLEEAAWLAHELGDEQAPTFVATAVQIRRHTAVSAYDPADHARLLKVAGDSEDCGDFNVDVEASADLVAMAARGIAGLRDARRRVRGAPTEKTR